MNTHGRERSPEEEAEKIIGSSDESIGHLMEDTSLEEVDLGDDEFDLDDFEADDGGDYAD